MAGQALGTRKTTTEPATGPQPESLVILGCPERDFKASADGRPGHELRGRCKFCGGKIPILPNPNIVQTMLLKG